MPNMASIKSVHWLGFGRFVCSVARGEGFPAWPPQGDTPFCHFALSQRTNYAIFVWANTTPDGQVTNQPDFQGILGPDQAENPVPSNARGDVCWRLGEGAAGPSTDRFAPLELFEESGIGGNTKERALGSLSAGSCPERLSSQHPEVLGQLFSRCS